MQGRCGVSEGCVVKYMVQCIRVERFVDFFFVECVIEFIGFVVDGDFFRLSWG